MIYSLYKSNLPLVLIGLPFIIGGLWLGQMIGDVELNPIRNTGTVFALIKSFFPALWMDQVFAMVIIVCSAVLLNSTINREEFFEKQTFLPAYIYVLVMSIFPDYQLLHPIVIANFFVILAIRRLFHIKRSDDARRMIFDAGLFIGISAIFYQYYVGFYFLAWITLGVLRPFAWREHVLGILGLLVPFLFLLFYLFMIDQMVDFYDFLQPRKQYHESFIALSPVKRGLGIGVALITSVLGARFFLRRQRSSSLRFKRISNIVLFMGLIILLLTGLHIAFRFEAPTVFMGSVFAAFLVTFYFYHTKKQKLAAVAFYIISLLAVVNIYWDFVHNIFR